MRKTEHFNEVVFFNNNFKLDIKTIFDSDIVRLTLMATLIAIGLYAIQYINILG